MSPYPAQPPPFISLHTQQHQHQHQQQQQQQPQPQHSTPPPPPGPAPGLVAGPAAPPYLPSTSSPTPPLPGPPFPFASSHGPGTPSTPAVVAPVPVPVPMAPISAPLPARLPLFTASASVSAPSPGATAVANLLGTTPAQVHQRQAEALSAHLYENGFIRAMFSDCILYVTPHPPPRHREPAGAEAAQGQGLGQEQGAGVGGNGSAGGAVEASPSIRQHSLKLHSLILACSPLLAQILSMSPTRDIILPIADPNITEEALHLSIGHLYGPFSLQGLTAQNAKAVLAAASFLQLDDLCQAATELCKQGINRGTIIDWVSFVEARPPASPPFLPPTPASSTSGSDAGGGEGGGNGGQGSNDVSGPYGQWSKKLRAEIMRYLVESLPSELGAFGVAPSATGSLVNGALPDVTGGGSETATATTNDRPMGTPALQRIYSMLPFSMFKAAVEHPSLPVPTDQERFKFAKACISERKRRRTAGGPIAEETVVLAFGGAGGAVPGVSSNVHVTRRERRQRLWKVSG